jgi:hypothetical protein
LREVVVLLLDTLLFQLGASCEYHMALVLLRTVNHALLPQQVLFAKEISGEVDLQSSLLLAAYLLLLMNNNKFNLMILYHQQSTRYTTRKIQINFPNQNIK